MIHRSEVATPVTDAQAVNWAENAIDSADNFGSILYPSTEAMLISIALVQQRQRSFIVTEFLREDGSPDTWCNESRMPMNLWELDASHSQRIIDEVFN